MTNRPARRTLSLLLAPVAAVALGCAGGPPSQGPPPGGPQPGNGDRERGGEEGQGAVTPAQEAALRVDSLAVSPDTVRLRVGEAGSVEVVARDSAGDAVEEGETILVLESMKMEIPVESPCAGRIAEIRVSEVKKYRWSMASSRLGVRCSPTIRTLTSSPGAQASSASSSPNRVSSVDSVSVAQR